MSYHRSSCNTCFFHVFVFVLRHRCGTRKPEAVSSSGGGGGRGGGGECRNSGQRPGDWGCPQCGNNCFASKSVCNRYVLALLCWTSSCVFIFLIPYYYFVFFMLFPSFLSICLFFIFLVFFFNQNPFTSLSFLPSHHFSLFQ